MRVVKLAQPGYNAKTAGDENLIYSSKWPTLKIYKQGSFTVPSNSTNVTIAEHDLGFTPAYWVFSNTTIDGWSGGALSVEERSEFFGPGTDATRISDKRLFYSSASPPDGALRLYYYIFALDLNKEFTAPIINVGAVGGGLRSQKFKVAKAGKNVHSDNLDDFIIHSDARSPLIHSVTPGKLTFSGSDFRLQVNHDLGYNPMFFGYTKNSDSSYSLLATGSSGSSLFVADEKTVYFREATGGREMTILILKDPFLVDYAIGASV